MRAKIESFAPIAFWIGFLALGAVTSLYGPDKHVARAPRATKTSHAAPAAIARTNETSIVMNNGSEWTPGGVEAISQKR